MAFLKVLSYNKNIKLKRNEGREIKRSDIEEEILKSYIREIKKLIAKDEYTLANRAKNRIFMEKYGLDNNDLKDVMLSLRPSDCISKCESDRDGYLGMIYKFKKDYKEEIIIYIKTRYDAPNPLVLISFHEDEC